MTKQDKEEFEAYLVACTDSQVIEVMKKEQAAGRKDYAALAELEARKWRLTWL